jgi:phosphoribosylformimino-5-aminoimidazole carboxamide ribonucleotide (ProFAR) isomerase
MLERRCAYVDPAAPGRHRGVEGAIVGTALYEGRFTLPDALALTRTDAP